MSILTQRITEESGFDIILYRVELELKIKDWIEKNATCSQER